MWCCELSKPENSLVNDRMSLVLFFLQRLFSEYNKKKGQIARAKLYDVLPSTLMSVYNTSSSRAHEVMKSKMTGAILSRDAFSIFIMIFFSGNNRFLNIPVLFATDICQFK